MKISYILLIIMLNFFSFQKTTAQDIGKDWSQLNKYKKANKTLEAAKPNENRIVFMGNSITEGWSNHHPEFFEGKPYVNRGISGQTTPQMLIRFKQDVVHLSPKAVVICAGTNDIAENTGYASDQMIMDNITSMIEIAQNNGIKVILASVHPAFDYPWRKGLKPNERIPSLNAKIKTYAIAKNIPYVDYFDAMNDGNNGLKKELTYDGVHPNKNGYLIMGPLVEKAIKETLKK